MTRSSVFAFGKCPNISELELDSGHLHCLHFCFFLVPVCSALVCTEIVVCASTRVKTQKAALNLPSGPRPYQRKLCSQTCPPGRQGSRHCRSQAFWETGGPGGRPTLKSTVCLFVLFFVTTRNFSGPESKFHFSFLVLGWSGDMSRTETELRPKWIQGDDLLGGTSRLVLFQDSGGSAAVLAWYPRVDCSSSGVLDPEALAERRSPPEAGTTWP